MIGEREVGKYSTGLPYSMELMNDIRDNGAIIDMNNINFPSVEQEDMKKVAFIFLRNTDFDVEYDFSKCSYEDKCDYLMTYLTTAVDYKIEPMIQTWMAILCVGCGFVLEDLGILTLDEIKTFIESHFDFVGELINFIISIPVYAVYRFEVNGDKWDVSDIKVNEFNLFNDNVNHLLYHTGINIVLHSDTVFEPSNYIHYFTNTNNKLFDAIQEQPYMAMLVGMSEKTPEEWHKFMEEYTDVIRENN